MNNRQMHVRRIGVEESLFEDVYYRLLQMSWPRFFALVTLIYVVINLIFSFLYAVAPDAIAHADPTHWFSFFAFSVQTFSTIGYGYFYPQTTSAHVLVTLESAIGLISTALLTGMIFAKFARPLARIVFSDKILWVKQNGKDALMLRLGNVRTNQVYEGQARMTLLRDEVSKEGDHLRRLIDLKLMRDQTPLFILSWTLIHLIDESSPLHGLGPEDMRRLGLEIYVTFRGLDQDMGQAIVAHSLYGADQIQEARKFQDMIQVQNGRRTIDFSKLHQVEL